MPYTLAIENNWISVKIFGRISGPELMQYASDLVALDATQPTALDRYTDFSEAIASDLSFNEIRNFADARRQATIKNPIRSAIWVPNDEPFGVSRIFGALNSNPQITVRTFRTREEALEWLSKKD